MTPDYINNPRWFWQAFFFGGGTATFYANSLDEARDHARTLSRDFGKGGTIVKVTRLKHRNDVTPEENAAAGALQQGGR